MPNGCIDGWVDLREKFVERFALRRRCSKDPTEVSKIVRRANKTLPDFKERWTEEMRYIQGVPEVMQISAFMSNSKCRRYDNRRFKNRRQEINHLSLEALVKRPNEILATELQLQLPPCPPMIGTPKKENLHRYCDYHGENGHYTNDCYQLKREEGKKCKHQPQGKENWMNVPITFPPIQSDDVSDEPLILEAKVKGYLAIPSTTHAMMKFPAPRGIATLVPRTTTIFECRQLEEKQILPEEQPEEKMTEKDENSVEEEVMINPTFPDQKVIIGT
ncbi:hypothetical protein Tco_0400336 [Tanacetum coccineum]